MIRALLLAVLAAGALAVWRVSRQQIPETHVRWVEPEDGFDGVPPMDPYLASLVNDFTYYPTR